MGKYDLVIGAGCSFMDGAAIKNEKEEFDGQNHLPIKYLSEKINCEYHNLAKIGSSNDRILSSVFNYVEENKDNRKKIVIIGLSNLWRMHFQPDVNFLPSYMLKTKTYSKFLKNYDGLTENELKTFTNLCFNYFYDEKFLTNKLKERIKLLSNYLNTEKIDYIIFNSLNGFLNLNELVDDTNTIIFGNTEKIWNEYLKNEHDKLIKKTSLLSRKKLIMSKPPWGRYFCGDHPSPHANKDLADLLYKKIVNNGWID